MTNCGVFSGIVTYFSSHAEEKKDKVFELAPLHLDLLTILAEQIESLSDIKRILYFERWTKVVPLALVKAGYQVQ